MRVFLDANVLFSASNQPSNLPRLVELLARECELVTCDLALEEVRRNIMTKRPAWEGGLQILQKKLRVISTQIRKLPVELAEKDVAILSSAIAADCQFLVTGDKRDFGHLFGKTIDGVRVESVAGITKIILKL